MSRKAHVQTQINGENVEFLCEPRQSMLEVLRDCGVALDGVPRQRECSFHWSGEYEGDMAQAVTHETRVEILTAFDWEVPHEWCQPAALLLCNNDPSIQLRLLEQVQAGWVAADSMNLWIETQRTALERVVAQTDLLFLNDAEAIAYSGTDTLLSLIHISEPTRRYAISYAVF